MKKVSFEDEDKFKTLENVNKADEKYIAYKCDKMFAERVLKLCYKHAKSLTVVTTSSLVLSQKRQILTCKAEVEDVTSPILTNAANLKHVPQNSSSKGKSCILVVGSTGNSFITALSKY